MLKHGKKYQEASKKIQKEKPLPVVEALDQVKKLAYVKFDETVDAHINLGIDAEKSDQGVRGSVVLPHGRGKKVRIIVFAKGEYADQATKAGADEVGAEDLVEKVLGGWMDFDYAVATPDLMGMVGKLAKLLGPRGLLPNKKVGTVTFDIKAVVSDIKRGRIFFKNDKSGLIHFAFGKVSFSKEQLSDNFIAFAKALQAAKPASSKGKFLKKITVSSTMGVGIAVNPDDIFKGE
jgi:large subunit ribosomal protein L1